MATQKVVGARFVCPKVKSDVKRWVCFCLECQWSKIQRHNLSSLSSFPITLMPRLDFGGICYSYIYVA